MAHVDVPAEQRGFAAMSRADGQCSLLLDQAFDIVWHTSSTRSVLGFDTMVGLNGLNLIHPDDLPLVVDLLEQLDARPKAADSGPAFRPDATDVRLLTASGEWQVVEAVMHDHTSDPAVRGYLVTCRILLDRSDIGRAVELIGTGAAVADALSLIARLVDKTFGGQAHCSIAWWSDNGVACAWSPDLLEPIDVMLHAARHAVRVGVSELMSISDLSDPILVGAGRAAEALGYSAASIIPIVSPSSSEVLGCVLAWRHHEMEMTLYPQRPTHIGLRLAALAIVDGRTKNSLRWAASHDPLTLLVNRAEFARRLDAIKGSVAMLYIDLDDFKPVNDMYGHSVGDAVLVEVAARIRETVGEVGVAGRLGGDEFAVAVPGLDDVTVGLDLAARIIASLRRPIRVGDVILSVGASVGVALGHQPLIPSVLIQRADEALIDAKNAGKNRVIAAA